MAIATRIEHRTQHWVAVADGWSKCRYTSTVETSQSIERSRTLHHLELRCFEFLSGEDEEVRIFGPIARGLRTNRSLKNLNLHFCRFDCEPAMLLLIGAAIVSHIETLAVGETEMGFDDVHAPFVLLE